MDGGLELGPDSHSAIQDVPSRRRLFEGGSAVASSTISQSTFDLRMESSSVTDQAASLSARAVAEEAQHGLSPIESEHEEDEYNMTVNNSHHEGLSSPGNLTPQRSLQGIVSENSFLLAPIQSNGGPDPHGSANLVNAARYIPSVLLGLLLNILDGLSYGMILFPMGLAVFSGLESAGLAMFYTSTIISQLVFSFGASGFKSCVGSEMIEIVPFFHALATSIAYKLNDRPREEILATTVAAFSFSCILTGLTFFLLGYLRLGTLVGFFPLHILLGCIGGVGWFLIATGIEVSARLTDGLQYDWHTLSYLFRDISAVMQWGSCLTLGVGLFWAEHRLRHPLVVPLTLILAFITFYVVIALIPNLSLDDLRQSGWIFPAQKSSQPWYWVYSLYRPSLIHVRLIFEAIPTMLALTFFGIIHVPINIPALAAAIKEDSISVNRELVAHGISNTLAGCLGSIQNYLVYTNSVLFIRSGADSRMAGVMLAIATSVIMVAGPVIIGYIPIIVVASLIFMMGFDLLSEALVDTFGKVRRQDYATIVTITLIMGLYDFVVGIVVGIMLACLFFVITSARRSPIQATMSGVHAHSTVIRHPVLQRFLSDVGKQVYIMRLTGALFFGTNGTLEREVRHLFETHGTRHALSIKYLIMDLEHVSDIDYCTVDTFLRLKRLLDSHRIRLVLSGAETAGHKIRGLKAVDLVPEENQSEDSLSVKVFATLNIALSWCENEFIREYFQHRAKLSFQKHTLASSLPPVKPLPVSWGASRGYGDESFNAPADTAVLGTTPRTSHRQMAARSAVREDFRTVSKWTNQQQPIALIMQVVERKSIQQVEFWSRLAPFLVRNVLSTGSRLLPGFHFIESGSFRLQYDSGYYEIALGGTAIGELVAVSGRKPQINAESTAVIWTLSQSSFIAMRQDLELSDLVYELMSVHLAQITERYSLMTDYYRIAD